MPYINYRNKQIFFTDTGSGNTLVLLHGFTESSSIWTRLARILARQYRVIAIDLPGHGKSECLGPVHTMEGMAGMVYSLLNRLKAGKCLMIGHSMGGYVTQAFAGKYPDKLSGFCLFHSHCFPDTETDRRNRERTIGIVKEDKFGFVAQFIPGLFPEEVRGKFAAPIDRMVREAAGAGKEGIIAALEGMKVRYDQSDVLRTTKLPILFILGLKDSRAPVDRFWEMISLPARAEVLILRECGHMGFIEAPEATTKAITAFAGKVFGK
ncbi:MAG TPA: alpha/beta hydrolase [Bacteroidales bacterium]|nr:alpha/beta hydrolase [Bacteroidales bacterium]HPS63090.1 alpha/beta hydrolase [Bacteroidales bacterium]